jgi:tetratricopeptide (TPR) repeat protein
MTTHIFLALGMWADVERQNAIASGPHREHWMPGHYTAWYHYALLQLGRMADARRHLEAMRTNLGTRDTRGGRGYLLSMRAHYLVNAEQWDDPARSWEIGRDGLSSVVVAMDAFALGLAAVRRRDHAEARRRLAELSDVRRAAKPASGVLDILERQLRAMLLLEDHQPDQAIALLRDAAAVEDSLPAEFGPPDVVKPTYELLGEVLLARGRPTEAERAFRRALALAPGRLLARRGLERAAAEASAQLR